MIVELNCEIAFNFNKKKFKILKFKIFKNAFNLNATQLEVKIYLISIQKKIIGIENAFNFNTKKVVKKLFFETKKEK